MSEDDERPEWAWLKKKKSEIIQKNILTL